MYDAVSDSAVRCTLRVRGAVQCSLWLRWEGLMIVDGWINREALPPAALQTSLH